MVNRSSSRESGAQPLKARLKQLTVEAILDAAEEVFAEHGLSAGMDAIAQKAGVAVGTLYNHFADRQALTDALVAQRRSQLLAAMDAAIAGSLGLPFRERLRQVLGAMVDAMAAHTRFRQQLLEDARYGNFKHKRETSQQFLPRLGLLFAHGEKEGALAPDPLAPVIFLGIFGSLLHLSLDAPRKLPMHDIPERTVRAFLDGAARP